MTLVISFKVQGTRSDSLTLPEIPKTSSGNPTNPTNPTRVHEVANLRTLKLIFGCEHSVHRLFCSASCFKSSKLTIDFIDSRVCHGWGGLTEPYLKKIGARDLTFPFIWAMCVFMLYSDCFYRKGWKGLIDLDLDGCPHHRIRTST